MSVRNIWTDVKLMFFFLRGDHPCQCAVSAGPTKPPQYMRISRLITVTYLLIHWFLSTCTLLDSVSNGSLQWSISCLVWFPWWLRHGAMVPREGTLFRVNWTSEFTHFNVGIRLGKVQQSPCRLPPFCKVSPILLSLWTLGTLTVAQVKPCRTTTNLFFCRRPSCLQCNMSKRQPACPFPAGVVFFGFRWGQTDCAPNSLELNFNRCLLSIWLGRQR